MKQPQIHLRDLLWLTLLAAALIGWWVDRRRLQATAALEASAMKQMLREERDEAKVREQQLIDRWFANKPARDE